MTAPIPLVIFDKSYYNTSMLEHVTAFKQTEDFTAVQQIYSVSFLLYPWIGCIVSMLVSVFMSLFTSPPTDFDERCMFNFRKHVWEELFVKRKDTRNNKDIDEQCPDIEMRASFLHENDKSI